MSLIVSLRRCAGFTLGAAALALGTSAALAQAYPNKPIKVIVPFPAGAGDQVARLLTSKLSTAIGQPILVENMPGASGVIGTVAAIKAPADGYTLVTATNSMVNGPVLGQPTPFNALKDLTPIALWATGPHVLATASTSPYRTLAQLVAAAKAKPDALSFASAGNGTVGHLFGELFNTQAGVKMLHVPYKGGGPALVDVMGGQVTVVYDVLSTTQPQVQGGKLRGLAITSEKRSPLLPEVPTMAELGYPDFKSTAWFGIMAPAGTPPAIIQYLNAEINKVLKLAEVTTQLTQMGLNAEGGAPDRFVTNFNFETARWTKVVKEGGIKGE